MDALINSLLLVSVAEIGDKTQLLAIILVARYRKIWPIIWGILISTTLNHAGAAWLGLQLGGGVDKVILQWVVSLSFIAIGLWVLKPDKMDDEKPKHDYGAFITTCITFFIAEIGDKTQLATIALAAQYQQLVPVLLGTTAGMMVANVPAVLFGQKLLQKIPMRVVHIIASVLFIAFGVFGLWELLFAAQ